MYGNAPFHRVWFQNKISTFRWGVLRTTPHHAVPSQEVRDDFFVDVVHQSSCTLVVVSSVNQELLTGVLVNQRADLEPTEN